MQKLEKQEETFPKTSTDWDRLRKMTDEDIQRGIDNDPDSAPALTYEEVKKAYKPHPPRVRR